MCGWHSCDCFFPKAATFYSGSRNNPKSDQAGATGAWVTRKRSLAAAIDKKLLSGLIHCGPVLPGRAKVVNLGIFLAVLPDRQEGARTAAAERPGTAREAAGFRGSPLKSLGASNSFHAR